MKYFLGILGGLLLLIFVLVLIFRGGSDNVTAPEVKRLAEYASEENTTSQFTIAGAINGEEDHRIVSITVTDSARRIEILEGYDGRVLERKSYPNTTAAFEAFLAGLEQAGFSNERRTRVAFESVCPDGRRFSYGLESGDESVVDTWSASCEKGSFAGKPSLVQSLFQAQIPEYNEFTSDVSFSL
jgi:hypothetical protein